MRSKSDVWEDELDAEAIASEAAEAADSKNAQDIEVLDMGDLLIITDFFVIASGTSDRQVRTIYDAVEERLKGKGVRPLGIEGQREGKWIVVDYGSVVVHIFLAEQREFYQLERLWRDAPRYDWKHRGAIEA